MRSGQMRHSVLIERRVDGTDSEGQPVDSWVAVAIVMAAIQPLNGREFFEQAGYASDITARIRIRWQPLVADVSPADRITHGTTVYDIISVINHDERNRELVIMASERERGFA